MPNHLNRFEWHGLISYNNTFKVKRYQNYFGCIGKKKYWNVISVPLSLSTRKKNVDSKKCDSVKYFNHTFFVAWSGFPIFQFGNMDFIVFFSVCRFFRSLHQTNGILFFSLHSFWSYDCSINVVFFPPMNRNFDGSTAILISSQQCHKAHWIWDVIEILQDIRTSSFGVYWKREKRIANGRSMGTTQWFQVSMPMYLYNIQCTHSMGNIYFRRIFSTINTDPIYNSNGMFRSHGNRAHAFLFSFFLLAWQRNERETEAKKVLDWEQVPKWTRTLVQCSIFG